MADDMCLWQHRAAGHAADQGLKGFPDRFLLSQ